MPIHLRPDWHLPERAVTAESHWRDRRQFIESMVAAVGLGSICLAAGCKGTPQGHPDGPLATSPETATSGLYPVKRNPAYTVERPLTDPRVATRYNNFYEFSTAKDDVWKRVDRFEIRPWSVKLSGLVENPGPVDFEDLVRRMPLEERVYRFRCVEAWAMVVPWSGFPLADLVAWAAPRPEARWIRLVTAHVPAQMPGAAEQAWFPWPYHEALSLAEARNPLAFVATGIYGRELPKQHGAPLRLVAPWKYGFKSIKSVVELQFTAEAPRTFWNSLAPDEYDLHGNVDPRVPHPRWSQASERMIGTGERRPTLLYNGYGAQVAGLYRG